MKRIVSILLAVLMLAVCLFATTGCSVMGKLVKSDYDRLYDHIKEEGVLTSGGYYVTTNTKSSYDYGFMINDDDEVLWYISSETSNGTESFLSIYINEDPTTCRVLMNFGETTMSANINAATYSKTNNGLSNFTHNGYSILGETYEKLMSSTLALLMIYAENILPEDVTMEGLGFTAY